VGQPTSAALFIASASQLCTLSPNQAYHLGMSQYLQNTDAHLFDYPAAANFFLRDEPDEDEEEEPEDDEEEEDEDEDDEDEDENEDEEDDDEDEDENGDDGYSE